MAVMSSAQRAETSAEYQTGQESGAVFSCTKGDLRAAVDAVDAWVDANAASFNAALPLPARTALTARQKAQLLMYVVAKRFNLGV